MVSNGVMLYLEAHAPLQFAFDGLPHQVATPSGQSWTVAIWQEWKNTNDADQVVASIVFPLSPACQAMHLIRLQHLQRSVLLWRLLQKPFQMVWGPERSTHTCGSMILMISCFGVLSSVSQGYASTNSQEPTSDIVPELEPFSFITGDCTNPRLAISQFVHTLSNPKNYDAKCFQQFNLMFL